MGGRLPSHISVMIIDLVVFHIQETWGRVSWMVFYDAENEQRLGLVAPPASESQLSERAKGILSVGIINKRSWAWILDNFCRSFIHSKQQKVFIFENDVLQLPLASATDWNKSPLAIHGYQTSPTSAKNTVQQSSILHLYLLPPPSAYPVFEKVRFVTVDNLSRLCPHSASSRDTTSELVTGSLHRLPRLRAVAADFASDTTNNSSEESVTTLPVIAADFRPITYALPGLRAWVDEFGSRFAAIWRPLQEKGVRLYLRDPETKQAFSEIAVKGQALMVRGVSLSSNLKVA